MTTQRPHTTLEIQSRYAVIGSLADGKRVLDIGGDAGAVLALAEAGAAELTVASNDANAVRADLEAAEVEGVEVVPFPTLPLQFEDDAFDLVIHFDLGSALVADDTWRVELRRVLASDGYLIMALPRPDGQAFGAIAGQRFEPPLTYEEAYERLAESFGNLTLMGQTAIAANLFYDFGSEEEDPDPLLDRSFLPDDEEVGWYLLIFGPEEVRSDDLTVVQVPFGDIVALTAGRTQTAVAGDEVVEALERELHVLRERNAALEERSAAAVSAPADSEQAAKLDEAEKLAGEARRQVAELEQEAAEGHRRAEELAEEREQLAARITALEAEMAEQREALTAKAAELQEELDTARAELEAARPAGEEKELLAAAEKTIAAQEEQLREALQRAASIEEALTTARAEAEQAGAPSSEVDELRQRVGELTGKLDEAQWAHTEATHAMAALRDQVARLEATRDDLADKGEAATEELLALRGQVAELGKARDELATQVGTLQAQDEAQRSAAESEAEQRTERARTEATAAAEQRAEAAEARIARLRVSEMSLKERLENLEVELDVARDAYEQAVKRFEDQLTEKKTEIEQRAAKESESAARVAQLEAEVARQTKDRQSFEAQIKDLLEEVTQLREADEAVRTELSQAQRRASEQERVARDTGGLESELEQTRNEAEQRRKELEEVRAELDQVRHALEARTQEIAEARNGIGRELGEAKRDAELKSNAVRQEKARAEQFLEELALAKKRLADVEAENANLAAEAQRLTDALHAKMVGLDAAQPDEDDYDGRETVVAEMTLPRGAAPPAGEETKAPSAAQVRRDSVGRPVENALEDIEDLIASSVPPSPTRR